MNVAFIPVRGGSKSIPLKNIKLINNRPLVYWSIDAAVNSLFIDKVYVCTDSKEIKEIVEKYPSNKVEVIGRSKESSTDEASTELVMLEFAENNYFNNIVLIQATSPLITYEDIDEGFEKLNNKEYDSVLSVVRQKRFIWKKEKDGQVRPINYSYMNRPRRQEFGGFLVENGAFYITSKKMLLESKCRISGKIGCVEMSEESYFEIDEISDWEIVENFLKKIKNKASQINKIKMLLTDSDGVLTDGGMYYTENGDEMKKFNTKDGMAFELLRNKGIKVGIITGENRKLINERAEKIKVDELYMGVRDKLSIVKGLCEKYNIKLDEIAYIGDDINDLEVISSVGLGCSVNDGMKCVKDISGYVTRVNGGQGAVREVAELIINKYV